jgi:hypothetical protein
MHSIVLATADSDGELEADAMTKHNVGTREEAQAARDELLRREKEYLELLDTLVTPEIAGTALVELVQVEAAAVSPTYLLTGAGLQELP